MGLDSVKSQEGGSEGPGKRFHSRFGRLLGIDAERKVDLYLELSRGSTLRDVVYWLQIFFSAGIATLGLVLNSPAVIIGAMLISPLMGPILAAGLAFSSGDVILGLRSGSKIILSSALAVAFTVLLVLILPFREMTAEIAARTQPNTLDLVIALFSGAVGSIAVCRDVKGIATSIPGVAIAVALMPPLCVAGYGLGLMITQDRSAGWLVASGGGLLFLTNLVAITFTAMLIFLAVNLNTGSLMKRVEEWAHDDRESMYILGLIGRFPRFAQAREIRNLPVRFVMILAPLAAILVPLSGSFDQLRSEIVEQRRANTLRRSVTEIWQDNFGKNGQGGARSTIDSLSVSEDGGKLTVTIRVFGEETYTTDEKNMFAGLVAERLGRPSEAVTVRLTEIPTSNALTALRERYEKRTNLSVSELQANLVDQFDSALSNVELPPNARLVNRQMVLDGTGTWNVNVSYLCDTELDTEVQESVIETIRSNLKDRATRIRLDRIATEVGLVEFPRAGSSIPILGMIQLDFAGRVMRENEALTLVVTGNRAEGEAEKITDERLNSIAEYLGSRWQLARERIIFAGPEPGNRTRIEFALEGESLKPTTTPPPE